ncbi:hypothetical protein D7D52_27230 [Nocardia yunnanensis]|uniref:DUF732 domain-containing protein n=1 Tax=Nocardia yunnanensis TaxID=2382165 RepID=A0A386ZH81_9NOCA|nr:hypothetical protein [Nocardia yunnanensis]AYF76887.1 hypothetical protein D7D52_27230 [Nocardia yunnanensis]
MRKLLWASLASATVIAGVAVSAGTAEASPPPPGPACAVFSYPAILLIEATGGQSSPLLPLANSIQPLFCS